MKKINQFIAILFTLLILSSCIKNEPVIVSSKHAEFDATALNSNAAGLTYPIISRVPAYGRVSNALDSTLRRYQQTIRVRVNLVGAQSAQSETVGYEVFTSTSPITTYFMPRTIPGQTPFSDTATLSITHAVVGTHFTALSGTLTIPANSSFGFLDFPILNAGPMAASGRFIGLRLNDNGTIKASFNYRDLGLVIDQR